MVICLPNTPSAAALYPTVILVLPPTATGLSFSHSGVVQPQLAATLEIFRGVVPTLNTSNM
jgi:hypothetical protein